MISHWNGKVISVTQVSSGQTAEPDRFGDVDTIEKLFVIIRDAYKGTGIFEQNAETVNVTYHPEMGYPLTIYIDVSSLMADEEQGFTVAQLVQK